MATTVKRCECINEYQDKVYGKGNRVVNIFKSTPTEMKGRCTVCGKEKSI